jgi:quinol monooxygenase YgiN
MVRLAELEIDATQLTAYLAALREEIDTSIRVEPGVLTLYAVQLEGEPTRVRLFEMYADSNAYKAHIASAHFRKYKTGTATMVKSLNLLEDGAADAPDQADRPARLVRRCPVTPPCRDGASPRQLPLGHIGRRARLHPAPRAAILHQARHAQCAWTSSE